MLTWRMRPVTFVNARVAAAGGLAGSLRFDSRVLGIDTSPGTGDVVVDLDGAYVLPGLINAHDHLELNHYGLLKRREKYENAADWIDDLRPALRDDPDIRRNSSFPLAARLFIGALKNVLAGVTTVAHHNPRYREIGKHFPVRVPERYGWAHSFTLEEGPVGAHGQPGGSVRDRCLATPPHVPFIVHLAEGTDAAAASELPRLEALGCLRSNTVIVHGVALTPDDWTRVTQCGAGLVWCPASNMFLFARTAPVRRLLDASCTAAKHVCLGSDSRVTGARDLLEEMRAAAAAAPVTPLELLRMVTEAPASMLNLPHGGRIDVGAPADLLVVPPFAADAAAALIATSRRDVMLVVIDGQPLVGAARLRRVFAARKTAVRPVIVDGAERLASSRLARAIARSPIREPGVECLA
jgi:cytosine/adenosine deaminase-related metal-dependent hydrolase